MLLFSNRKPFSTIIEEVSALPKHIEKLELGGYKAGREGLKSLFRKMIEHNVTVHTLDLSYNLLGSKDFMALTDQLEKLEVKALKLSLNQLSDNSVAMICSLIQHNGIVLIDLTKNYFSPAGVNDFLQQCLSCDSLTSIMIDRKTASEDLIRQLEVKICQNADAIITSRKASVLHV